MVALAFLAGTGVNSQPQVAQEYEVKAAFLFRFAQFVVWPPRSEGLTSDALSIGIVGQDPFDRALENVVNGKTVGGRSIIIKRFPKVDDLEPCHVLFVSASVSGELSGILKALRGAPVLLVGETDTFAEEGGIIELFLEDRKVRFKVNLRAAARAGIEIDSRLLSLARLVNESVSR